MDIHEESRRRISNVSSLVKLLMGGKIPGGISWFRDISIRN